MKKLLLVSLCLLMFCLTQVYAQIRTVTGTVTAKEDGTPIPGASIKVKGTQIGTQTGPDGKFSINVPSTSSKILVFSFISYGTIEKPLGAGNVVNAVLEVAATQLGEVVVTGTFGRKSSEKAVGYAQTHLTAAETNLSAETNVLTGLTAKVGGLQVNTTGSGVDPGLRIVLRGNRSINGNNQALVVVDGSPVPNGDVSAIDPDIIESIDVLNGGTAGALYGSEASNGVIVITTKKGTADNKPHVTYSNSFQAQQAAYFPAYQQQYGQYGGETAPYLDPITGFALYVPYENQQYGPMFNGSTVQLGAPAGSATGPIKSVLYSAQAKDPRKAFYNTGYEEQNEISVNSGNADDYFGLTGKYALNKGITPGESNTKNSVNVRAGKRYGIFKAEYGVSYTNFQIVQNGSNYNGQSIAYSLDQFPANLNIKDFADPQSTFANPSDFYDSYATNPYWAVYNAKSLTTKNIFQGNVNLTLNPTKWLDVTYKISDNFGFYENKQTRAEVDFTKYAISDPLQSGNIPSGYATTGKIPGTVSDYSASGDGNNGYGRLQQDALLNFHHTFFNDFKTTLIVGASVFHQYQKNVSNGGTALLVPGLYNVNYNAGQPTAAENEFTINQKAYFSDLSIGYKDFAFIDASIRNDQDSRFVASARSYYYPAVSGSFVFTDAIPALKGNKILSYGKLRAAYSNTGQASNSAYTINNIYGVTSGFAYGSIGGLSVGGTNYTPIVPERITEIEFGGELAFFPDGLISTKATYYKQNSKNQTLNIGTSPSTGYAQVLTNVGELQSSGYEIGLTVKPLTQRKNKFGLEIGANLTNTESNVVSLLPNVPQFNISGGGGNEYAIVGQPYPVIKGTDFQKTASGQTIVSATSGYPLINSTPQILGRTTPEYMLGLTLNAHYKFISFAVVAEYRTGYVDYFQNAGSLIFGGTSTFTTQAGRQPFVYPNSVYANGSGGYVQNTNVVVADGNYGFWQSSAFNSAASPLVSSAAFWKIREANLSFKLDQFIKNKKYIKGVTFALNGRNLFMWVPKSNYWGDPELSTDASNATGFVSRDQVPGSRFFGGKLDITF